MRDKKILSIIMPVYNVEDYVRDSIYSLISQNEFDDMVELIIINDGATDSSGEIIESILAVEKNKNIIYLTQENQGLSAARNTGLSVARGEFIGYLDSDDLLHSKFLKIILNILLDKDNADIIRYNYSFFKGDRANIDDSNFKDTSFYLKRFYGEDIIKHEINDGSWYAWRRIYKRNLFDGTLFPQGKKYEDVITIPSIVLKAKELIDLNIPLVYYRSNPMGITKNTSARESLDVLYSIECFKYRAIPKGISDSLIREFNLSVVKIFINLVCLSKNTKMKFLFTLHAVRLGKYNFHFAEYSSLLRHYFICRLKGIISKAWRALK